MVVVVAVVVKIVPSLGLRFVADDNSEISFEKTLLLMWEVVVVVVDSCGCFWSANSL